MRKGEIPHQQTASGESSSVYDCHKHFMLPSCDYSLSKRLNLLHKQILKRLFEIDSIAVALYDRDTDILKTYAHSTLKDEPLTRYRAFLSEVPSLKRLANDGNIRITHNIPATYTSGKLHSQYFVEHGYLSSYTLPLIKNRQPIGFLFADSYQESCFTRNSLSQLESYIALIGNITISELTAIKVLSGSVSTLNHISRQRDPETGEHLSRMAHYAQLIAGDVAKEFGLSDEFIEHVFLFSPLHDIGKISVPDKILLKQGRLTEQEFKEMQQHTTRGDQIIRQMVKNMELTHLPYISVLVNIVKYHHEKMDGSGYPDGIFGNAIPIESRIVAVSDVFDALTSKRPYKKAWTNSEAIAWMKTDGKHLLDQRLVAALEVNMETVVMIQKRFCEDKCE